MATVAAAMMPESGCGGDGDGSGGICDGDGGDAGSDDAADRDDDAESDGDGNGDDDAASDGDGGTLRPRSFRACNFSIWNIHTDISIDR